MTRISRRSLITTGLSAVAGIAGLGVAAKLASRYGLIPPDAGVPLGAGETLTYAASRVFGRNAMAPEFSRAQISEKPFANEVAPLGSAFLKLQQGGFADWRLAVGGLVERPRSFSVAELMALPSRTQITRVACEEGWDYIAAWAGVPLAHILELVGTRPEARYAVYQSFQPEWYESIDMDDATHPQTIVAYGMNDGDLPVPFGGPLRLRVPRQLGYKSIKYITAIHLTDDLAQFGNGLGGINADYGYAWYAGI